MDNHRRYLSAIVILLACTFPGFGQGTTTLVSVSSDGKPGNHVSSAPAISADGRFVAFMSIASNLVPEDTNGKWDVFIRDLEKKSTTLVSVSTTGVIGNYDSGDVYEIAISGNGRYVAFKSGATNLVAGDTNGHFDIFVRDVWAMTTARVSVSSSGEEANSSSYRPAISADGRFVAFWSFASNLVPGDTNARPDVFLRDRWTGTTTLVSVASDGTQGNDESGRDGLSISADGRYVAFQSLARNLVPNDVNLVSDVFLRDTRTGSTSCLSVTPAGTPGSLASKRPMVSAYGHFAAFYSLSENLVAGDANMHQDAFLRDITSGITSLLSVSSTEQHGNSQTEDVCISADGRYAAFQSAASNLVPNDTNESKDVFLRNTQTGSTSCLSTNTDGILGNNDSALPCISADGMYVAFASNATDLVEADKNGYTDVFVRGPLYKRVYSSADVALCLRIAAGVLSPTPTQMARYNLDTGNPAITLDDAVLLSRDLANLKSS